MPQGLQAVLALMVLLPGFVSARIVRMMSQKTPQTELERVIEALIFSFFTYLIYLPVYYAVWGLSLPISWSSSPCVKATDLHKQLSYNGQCFDVSINGWGIAWIPVSAMVLGLVWGFVREKDLILRGLRRLDLTDRSAYESVWAEVFNYLGGSVQVGLGDGREVIGSLRQYSLADGERTLLLEDAGWVAEDGTKVNIEGDGLLLLTEEAKMQYVMFLDNNQRKLLDEGRQTVWAKASGRSSSRAEQGGQND